VHYAGSEKFIRKALAMQVERGPVFDIACDCEDGAPIGSERAHAAVMAGLIGSDDNRFSRVGARVHDVHHPAWQAEVDVLLDGAGDRIAFLTLPKAERAADVERFLAHVADRAAQLGLKRVIPVSVLIETPGAVHDAWAIAGLPGVVSLDFGLMDFVSAHHGAIPSAATVSPAQFTHPLVARAKCEIAAAALAHGIVPAHNVTRALDDPGRVSADARRAREEFGYLRMWSIHPSQIDPIVEAMRPDVPEVERAQAILHAAQEADWGPLRIDGELHDRASYRQAWSTLQRARAAGVPLDSRATAYFATA
jgi:citrate lyase subunit beta/citryl-CoA lyase